MTKKKAGETSQEDVSLIYIYLSFFLTKDFLIKGICL